MKVALFALVVMLAMVVSTEALYTDGLTSLINLNFCDLTWQQVLNAVMQIIKNVLAVINTLVGAALP